jgi:uncharacterized protein (TIGR03437 family)
MKKLVLADILIVLVALTAHAQAPTIGAVVNAASYALTALPNSGIAQGSIFIVFGSNMGPAALTFASGFPLPTTLPASNGTSVRVTVSGTTTSAYVVYTRADQLAAIMASNTPAGTGTLTVSYNGQTSAPAPVTVVANTFGIFAVNQQGSGPGVVTNAATQPSNPTNAANPGEVDVIWGTGLGPISGNDGAGPSPGNMPSLPLQVWVGGVQATVQYQGRSGCCAGLDQINFVVPAGVTGCYVPVYVTIGNTISNFVTMAIAASGRTCSDPVTGISSADLQTLSTTGSIRMGQIALSRTSISTSIPGLGTLTMNSDNGSASFSRYDAATFLGGSVVAQPSVYGSCTVFSFQGTSYTPTARPTPLDAGTAINISGPNGAKTLAKQATGSYSATLGGGSIPGFPGGQPDYLIAGNYTANNGSGGTDVRAFTSAMTLPQPLVWSNQSNMTVARALGQLITWTGGDPNSYVFITGTSVLSSPQVGSTFVCIAQVSAGRFTIPAAVLLTLAPTPSGSQVGGFLAVGSTSTPVTFTASGLDKGVFSSTVLSGATVTYQ